MRTDQAGAPTMTMPAGAAFPPPPSPTLQMPSQPSLSTGQTLVRIFFSPGRVFDSFRERMTFGPVAVRFLIAAAIVVVALVAYNVIYLARMGSERIARASMESTPQTAKMATEQKERAVQMQQNPAFQAFTLFIRFGLLIVLLLVSLPLGALIYWLGGMLFKGTIKYWQALLVWTYAALPPTVLWLLVNTAVLMIRPPTTNMGIVTGATGVIHANPGALFDVAMLPIPVHIAALSELDLFAFYGLTLAMVGLRRVSRIPWIGSFAVVILVWLIGVGWRVGMAGVFAALMK